MSQKVVAADDNNIRPIVCVRLIHPENGKCMNVNAFLDTCANRDVISKKVVEFLDLPSRNEVIMVTTLDSQITGERELASCTLESLASDYDVDIKDAIVGTILTGRDEIPPARRDVSRYPHLQNLPFLDAGTEDVDMLIGIGHCEPFFGGEVKKGEPKNLLGVKTCFGWTICGKSEEKNGSAAEAVCIDFISMSKATERDKWNASKENLKKGDLILICDDSLARCFWKTGRIVDTEGSDGHVRRAYVKKADGSVSLHDRSKMVKLETE